MPTYSEGWGAEVYKIDGVSEDQKLTEKNNIFSYKNIEKLVSTRYLSIEVDNRDSMQLSDIRKVTQKYLLLSPQHRKKLR